MTAREDSLIISDVVLILITMPALLRAGFIIIQACQRGHLMTVEFELGWALVIIGFGGVALGVVISAIGALIDGGFAG